MLLLINYDLVEYPNPERQKAIIEFITGEAIDYCRVMRTGWIVQTDRSPQVWVEALRPLFGKGERLLITQLHRDGGFGLIPEEILNWIGAKL